MAFITGEEGYASATAMHSIPHRVMEVSYEAMRVIDVASLPDYGTKTRELAVESIMQPIERKLVPPFGVPKD